MFRVIQWTVIVFAVLFVVINGLMITVMGRVLKEVNESVESLTEDISETVDLTKLDLVALEQPIRNWLTINFLFSGLNILMSLVVGYAAYYRERVLMIIWLYCNAIYVPLSVFNVVAVRDWCSAVLVYDIYFWILVFEFQKKLREVHYLKVAMQFDAAA